MWPLMRKRSLQFAVFAWIAICMWCITCLNRLSIRSNSSGRLCKKNLASVRTAQAIRAKKICIHLNGSCYPCKRICHPFEQLGLSVQKKLLTVRATGAICSKINFSRVSISQDNFVASHSRRTRYSWVVTFRSLFTKALWIVSYLFLLLYSHLRFHYYHSTIDSINTQFIQYLSFFHFNKFPENNVLTFHRCMQNTSKSKDMVSPRRIHVVGSFQTW